MLVISFKQCYVPSIGIGQVLAIFAQKASVLDRLVKTGISASLLFMASRVDTHTYISS